MHHSRLCAVLVDCKISEVDEAAQFWSAALGRAVDLAHAGSRGNYRMLETPPDEPIVEIQRVDHESRVHLDIETDDIPAEVARLEKLGASRTDGSTDCATLRRREHLCAWGRAGRKRDVVTASPSVSALWGNVVTCNREGGR